MTAAAAVRDAGAGAWLDVKVVPGASRDRVAGWLGGALKVQVAAAPERGRANERLCALLAAALQLPPRAARVVRGATNARKVVELAGITAAEVRTRLATVLAATPR